MKPRFAASKIDTSRPHPARLYDYYLGGKTNYAVDREAASEVLRIAPEARDIARANRAFLQRAVRFLAAQAGVRQFVDIGTGIPAAGSVHEVAQAVQPGARVVYVDNDPIVHVHANALLTGQGDTSIALADLRDPGSILSHPKVLELIDLGKPVGLLLIAIVHFITDEEKPAEIIAALRDALPPGSYLVLSHGTADFHDPAVAGAVTAVYERATAPFVLRDHDDVVGLFSGWDLVEPGVVPVPLWRPEGKPPRSRDLARIGIYGGVGCLKQRMADA